MMYIAAAICMWFLRAWKIGDLHRIELEKQEALQAQQGGVLRNKEVAELSRTASRVASLKSNAKSAKELFAWKRV